jgi:hypothetical protein
MRFWRPSRIQRRVLPFAWMLACAAVIGGAAARQPLIKVARPKQSADSKAGHGIEIVDHAGYPELHVDGSPFFIHSAAFFYYRIPADQWERLLRMYRAAGINTIDLYIPWNWHEWKEGEFDFDGHTNPRRNLRALLALIARENFKLIARPGPEILNEWRHGGYPGWLLDLPEYKMNSTDWVEGRYPPLDNLNATDAEAAAQGWLANSTHMEKSREWLIAVSKELAQYSAHRIAHMPSGENSTTTQDVSGPLLFVQLGDDFALGRSNRVGPDFWRYVESLRSAVEAGGTMVPVFINPTDMRVSAAGSDRARPIGTMGQWYMPRRAAEENGERRFTAGDAAEIEFFTEELKTQPDFPPVMIEYQAGWYTPGDDDRPIESPPQNMLLSSRLLIANGIHGLNYFPLQDTYSPAGYSVPWANRSYRWDAALAPDGEPQPRLRAVLRNMQILHRWGSLLAASHKRADFAIIYPLGAFPQDLLERADIARVSGTVMRPERLGAAATLSSELFDPQYQPVQQLLRDAVALLPVFDQDKPQFQLSEKAQRTIVEYVRRGGTLVVFPERPRGSVIDELWKDAPADAGIAGDSAIRARWKFGDGEVIHSSKDFYSWIALGNSPPEIRAERDTEWASGVLREFLAEAKVRPSVQFSGKASPPSELIVNEIVSNEGSEPLGARSGGRGFLSVTNLSSNSSAERVLEVLSPSASVRGGGAGDYSTLHVIVPPEESLLLPLDEPVCFADPGNAPCGVAISAAGAEFLDARHEGKSLEMLFYAPARAEVHLRVPYKPSHIQLDGNNLEADWTEAEHDLKVTLLRGAAPRFVRVLSVELSAKPHVPEPEKPAKPTLDDIDYFVANAVRLPVGGDAAMRSYPPLIIADKKNSFAAVLQAENQTGVANLALEISVNGALRGNGMLRLFPHGISIEKVLLKPAQNELTASPPSADGFLRSTMEIKMGHDRRTIPVAFLQPHENGAYHYRYDFDRDGADEWVLENSRVRLIVSPESGGRAIALVDKSTGTNLSTSVGLFRDNFSFTENVNAGNPERARGRHGLFNRPYRAEWLGDQKDPVLQLQYDAPDIYPGGASIEKSIQFDGTAGIRVNYRVALKAPVSEIPPGGEQPQSFVAVNSFPAFARPGRVTKFCWAEVNSTADARLKSETPERSQLYCEDFVAGGQPILVPAGIKRVEVQTTGRPTAAIEWDCTGPCARLTIEPKNFSALFRLESPPLASGGEPARYTIRVQSIEAH